MQNFETENQDIFIIASSQFRFVMLRFRNKRPARVNFINILRANFLLIFWCQKIPKPNVIREKLLNWLSCKKCAHKMLMKLTARGRFRHYFFHRWKIVSTQRWCSISPQHSSHTWTEFATTLCLISELNFVCRLTNMMCAVCQLMLFAVVNFINFFTYKFFVRMSFWQLFLCTCN